MNIKLACTLAVALAATAAQAATFVTAGTGGNGATPGYEFGHQFTAANSFTVTSLGAYDANGGGLTDGAIVHIEDSVTRENRRVIHLNQPQTELIP